MRLPASSWEELPASRVKLAFAIALLGLLSFATFTLLGFRDTSTLNSWVDHTYQIIGKVEDCYSLLNEAESSQRGYLITRQASFVTSYRRSLNGAEQDENDLARLTAENSVEATSIGVLRELVARKAASLDQLARFRSNPTVRLRMLQPQLQAGYELKRQIRDQIDSMEREEHRLLRFRQASTNSHAKIALFFFGVTTLSSVLLLTGVYNLVLRLLSSFAESRQRQLTYSTSLEQEVERTKAARKELERSNRELQDFAFVASHDLQEPLRKIRSYGDRLKTRAAPRLQESDITDLSRIQSAAERMQGLINDILALSRVTSKAQPFVSVDLNKVFDEVVDDLETRIKQTGAMVTRDALPTVTADPVQMRQLIQNLIGNALKFVRSDTVPDVKVRKLATPPSGMVGFVVVDNGIGFDDKHAEKIFTVFQRLHNRTEFEGTGVGLAICRRIVERHGGYVLAKGAVGEGATFTVAIPKMIPSVKEVETPKVEASAKADASPKFGQKQKGDRLKPNLEEISN
jgi:signal transduction histidine kinase